MAIYYAQGEGLCGLSQAEGETAIIRIDICLKQKTDPKFDGRLNVTWTMTTRLAKDAKKEVYRVSSTRVCKHLSMKSLGNTRFAVV